MGPFIKATLFFCILLIVVPVFARQPTQKQNSLDDETDALQTDPAKTMELMLQQMKAMDKASDKLFEDFFGEDPNAPASDAEFDKLQQQFLNRLKQPALPTQSGKNDLRGEPEPLSHKTSLSAEPSVYGAQVTQQNSQKTVTMRVEVPGLDASSLTIRVENGFLHLSGNSVGPFEKILPLPDEVDASKMDVKKHDGAIELIFAKLLPEK
jgi:HSP20 family molecular chaperone IbpA